MKTKPRWMKSVIKSAQAVQAPLPLGRYAIGRDSATNTPAKAALAKA